MITSATTETDPSFAGSVPAERSKRQTTITDLFRKARRALMQRPAPQPGGKRRKSDDTEKGRGALTPATTARNASRFMRGAFCHARQTVERAPFGDDAGLLSDTREQFWFDHWHGEHAAGSGQPDQDYAASNHLSPHL